MKAKHIYLLLVIAGLAIPSFEFVPWALEHGLNVRLMFVELFSTRIGGFFGLDVIVSAVVVFAFALFERQRIRPWWLPVVATMLGGVSVGLPLALYLREAIGESRSLRAVASE